MNKNDIFYKYHDFVSLPTQIKIEVYNSISDLNCFYSRRGISKYRPTDTLKNWILEQISVRFINDTLIDNISIQKITKEYELNPPHTDGSGECALFYFLELGGENVTTKWWIEKDNLLERNLGYKTGPEFNSGQLEELSSIIIDKDKWISLTTNILHSVHDVNSDRISIGIRLRRNPLIKNNIF